MFDQGVRTLAGEWDRRRHRQPIATTADQRLAVAGRIAARLLLSGRRSIRLDGQRAAATDMTDSSLPGGAELISGAPFDVTTPIVRETLRTALFTSAGTDRVTFRHSSIAAFLAARYLIDLDVPQQQLQDLLLIDAPDEDSAAIPTPLRETAAWCVQMNRRGAAAKPRRSTVPGGSRWRRADRTRPETGHAAAFDGADRIGDRQQEARAHSGLGAPTRRRG